MRSHWPFCALGAARTSRFLPARRELIREKRLAMRGKIATRYTLWSVEREAKRRIDELMGTVERLLEISDERVPQIRADLAQLDVASRSTVQE